MAKHHDLLDIIMMIEAYVEKELGGKIIISSDKYSEGSMIFKWEKYDEKIKELLHFDYEIPYVDLKSAKEPLVIGQIIVEGYRKKKKMMDDFEGMEK